jgi:hypothetical protein
MNTKIKSGLHKKRVLTLCFILFLGVMFLFFYYQSSIRYFGFVEIRELEQDPDE